METWYYEVVRFEAQHRDCESCGYATCKEMVRAIANNVNVRENCVHYVRSVAEDEMHTLVDMRAREQEELAIHQQRLAEITEQFMKLSDNIDELNMANEASANEAAHLAEYIQNITKLCASLNESVGTFLILLEYIRRAMKIFLRLQARRICCH